MLVAVLFSSVGARLTLHIFPRVLNLSQIILQQVRSSEESGCSKECNKQPSQASQASGNCVFPVVPSFDTSNSTAVQVSQFSHALSRKDEPASTKPLLKISSRLQVHILMTNLSIW